MRTRTFVSRSALRLVVLCCALVILGCEKAVPTESDADAVSEVQAEPVTARYQHRDELLADIEGVWSTTSAEGDDSETVYFLHREADDLRVFKDDNVELVSQVDDVDLANASVTIRVEHDGLTEALTFQRLAVGSAKSEGAGLRVTYGNGQADDLRFVRRLSGTDLDSIRKIRQGDEERAKEATQLVAAGIDCDHPSGFRAKTVCGDFGFREKQEKLTSLFDSLEFDHPVDIRKTEAAAWQQLDACKSEACLDAGYESWVRYLEANYETELMVD